jgi:hypothetical protein
MSKIIDYTKDALILWASVSKVGLNFVWRGYTENRAIIDEALKNPKKVCLLNVDNGGHWVLGVRRLWGGMYTVIDPWTGTKKMYSGVVGFAILSIK